MARIYRSRTSIEDCRALAPMGALYIILLVLFAVAMFYIGTIIVGRVLRRLLRWFRSGDRPEMEEGEPWPPEQ